MVVRWLAIAMMLIAGFEVVARYAFHAPAIWAPELSGMLFGPYFLLGGGMFCATMRMCPWILYTYVSARGYELY